MSTKIKNTLFRFMTMRAPQLLEKEKVDLNFVKHPLSDPDYSGELNSSFLDSINNIPTGKTKALALAEAAENFSSPVTNREQLHKSGLVTKLFYDFAAWLTANRTKLTMTEAKNKIISSNIDAIENEEHINDLWENLFYQIITSKSPYVRETILSLLVADFFINNHSMVPQTDAGYQKLAQARIIIPKELFEKEDVSEKKALIKYSIDGLPVKTKELNRELDSILSNDKIESFNSLIAELKKAQKNYNKKNQQAEELAKKSYEETVAGLYANAETIDVVVVDPVTTIETTVKEYINLVIPPFSFEREPELEFDINKDPNGPTPSSILSTLIEMNEFDTFDELIGYCENQIGLETQMVFNNTDFSKSMVSKHGIILPVTSVDISKGNTFAVGTNYTGANVPLTLIFSGAASNLDIVAAEYSLSFDDNTSVTGVSFVDSIVNNKLVVKIFNQGINLSDRNEIQVAGTLTISDGNRLEFSGTIYNIPQLASPELVKFVDGLLPSYQMRGNGTYKIEGLNEYIQLPDDIRDPAEDGSLIRYIPSGFGIKRMGIADYRKVEQEICCYVPGEVSHIENVMASEYREKSTRRLRRTEDTTTSSSEKEIEKLTDSTSTERFEMNQEVSSLLSEDTHVGAYANVSAEYHGVKLDAGADFANNTSSEESDIQAVTHAKEVTERALDRVVQKVKEERISKIIEEFEENNKHGFDNRKNSQHVSGVYRWVDKIYKNRIVNYGKRLMYEFMIPEPAAFHTYAAASKKDELGLEKLTKPLDPRVSSGVFMLSSHKDVLETNYQHWAAIYNAEVVAAPVKNTSIGKEFSFSGITSTGEKVWAEKASIIIPEGYKAIDAKVFATGKSMILTPATRNCGAGATVGNLVFDYFVDGIDAGREIPKRGTTTSQITLLSNEKSIPVTVTAYGQFSLGLTATILLERTPEYFEQWQIETFQSIIKAYETELEKYNAKMAQLKALQVEKVKTNPLFYRQVENTVLRKNCIEYLASHAALGQAKLTSESTSIKDFQVDYDNPQLEAYGAKVKFFEQAFEWNLMSYNLYPFYWADKNKWADLYNISESDDPTFRAFLQSGMARVIVTARPGFEEAVNWYMATGQIWNGGQVPTIDDPLFVSIVEELHETEGEVEETWESRVPTSLTVIQAGSIGLEVPQALPCDEDCADYKLFDSDGEPVLDGNGQQISTNPFRKYENVKLEGIDNTTPPVGS